MATQRYRKVMKALKGGGVNFSDRYSNMIQVMNSIEKLEKNAKEALKLAKLAERSGVATFNPIIDVRHTNYFPKGLSNQMDSAADHARQAVASLERCLSGANVAKINIKGHAKKYDLW